MRRTGGVRDEQGGAIRRATRLGAATLLAGALVAGSPLPGMAGPTDPGGGAGQPADPPGDGHDQGVGAAPAPLPAPPRPGTGLAPNGRAGGPATFVPVPADSAVVPEPPVNEDLPEEVDEKGPFAQQVSCDPLDRPGTTAFALLITSHYGRPAYSGARPCIDYASFHHDGRAVDWPLQAGVAADRQIADSVIVWLTDNDGEMAKRFGLEYLIWNHLIWHNDDRGWQHYTGTPHTDHIHFSFSWDGALMRSSWWTGVAVTEPDLGPCDILPGQYAALHQAPRLTPCDAPGAVALPATGMARVRPGESGPGVLLIQEKLGLDQTGVLDEATRGALMAWQEEQQLPVTGVADEPTYAELLGLDGTELPPAAVGVSLEDWQVSEFTPYLRTTLEQEAQGEAVRVMQGLLGVETDGSFGPLTTEALLEWEKTVPVLKEQAERRGDEPVTVTPLTWLLLERTAHPTMAVRDVELALGSLDMSADGDGALAARAASEGREDSPYAGGAVAFLQELLGVDVDGSFGPQTEAAVIEVQRAAELEPTGVVDGPTWAAVEAVAIEEGRAPGTAEAEGDEQAAGDEEQTEDD